MEPLRLRIRENSLLIREFFRQLEWIHDLLLIITVVNTAWAQWQMNYLWDVIA
jgi:hypothetical protein